MDRVLRQKRARLLKKLGEHRLSKSDFDEWGGEDFVGDKESLEALLAFCDNDSQRCDDQARLFAKLFNKDVNGEMMEEARHTFLLVLAECGSDSGAKLWLKDFTTPRELWSMFVKDGMISINLRIGIAKALQSMGLGVGEDMILASEVWKQVLEYKNRPILCEQLLWVYQRAIREGLLVDLEGLAGLCLEANDWRVSGKAQDCLREAAKISASSERLSDWNLFHKILAKAVSDGQDKWRDVVREVFTKLSGSPALKLLSDFLLFVKAQKRYERGICQEFFLKLVEQKDAVFYDAVFDVLQDHWDVEDPVFHDWCQKIQHVVSESKRKAFLDWTESDKDALFSEKFLVHCISGKVLRCSKGKLTFDYLNSEGNRREWLWTFRSNGRIVSKSLPESCVTARKTQNGFEFSLEPVDLKQDGQRWTWDSEKHLCNDFGNFICAGGDSFIPSELSAKDVSDDTFEFKDGSQCVLLVGCAGDLELFQNDRFRDLRIAGANVTSVRVVNNMDAALMLPSSKTVTSHEIEDFVRSLEEEMKSPMFCQRSVSLLPFQLLDFVIFYVATDRAFATATLAGFDRGASSCILCDIECEMDWNVWRARIGIVLYSEAMIKCLRQHQAVMEVLKNTFDLKWVMLDGTPSTIHPSAVHPGSAVFARLCSKSDAKCLSSHLERKFSLQIRLFKLTGKQ